MSARYLFKLVLVLSVMFLGSHVRGADLEIELIPELDLFGVKNRRGRV